MRVFKTTVAAWVALSLVMGSLASAHHSQSEFDSRAKVEVEGTVTKLEWKSPHAWVYLDVTDDKGEKANWSFELPSPATLMRRGWTRDSLKPGDRIKVNGRRAKNFPTIALADSIRDNTGRPVFTGTTQVYEVESDSKTETK